MTKSQRRGPILSALAAVGMLTGLALDEVWHALRPDVKETSAFVLSNPGHVLFGFSFAVLLGAVWLSLADSSGDAYPDSVADDNFESDPYDSYFGIDHVEYEELRKRNGRPMIGAITVAVVAATVMAGVGIAADSRERDTRRRAESHSLEAASRAAHENEAGIAASAEAAVTGGAPEVASDAREGQHVVPGEGHASRAGSGVADPNQLAQIRAATEKYKDANLAQAEGYQMLVRELPQMGAHFVNISRSQAATLDLEKPSFLLYAERDWGWELLAVGYSISRSSNPEPPKGLTGAHWHSHSSLCFMAGGNVRLIGNDDCKRRGGVWVADTGWLVHVWLYKENPKGIFEELNPALP